jgi:hypothetical protein
MDDAEVLSVEILTLDAEHSLSGQCAEIDRGDAPWAHLDDGAVDQKLDAYVDLKRQLRHAVDDELDSRIVTRHESMFAEGYRIALSGRASGRNVTGHLQRARERGSQVHGGGCLECEFEGSSHQGSIEREALKATESISATLGRLAHFFGLE